MDPVMLATVTSAVTHLATEVGMGLAGEAGKDVWRKIRSILGWTDDPAPADLAPNVAVRLQNDEQAARQITHLLQENQDATGRAAAMVGNIHAEKLVWNQNVQVAGDFTIEM